MPWLFRVLAISCVIAAAGAVLGTSRSPVVVLTCVAGSLVLAALGTAALWSRPLLAAALGWMWLTIGFAAGVAVAGGAGGAGASGAPAFAGLSPGDSAAIVVAVAALVAALGGAVALNNILGRLAVVALALYVIVPTAASVGHGGLVSALTSGPLAQLRGTYAGAELLLPLAVLAALAFALVSVARRRGARAAVALVTAIALLAATNLAAFTAGTAQLPTIVAFEHPPALIATVPLAGTGNDANGTAAASSAVPAMTQAPGGALTAPQTSENYAWTFGPATIADEALPSNLSPAAAVDAVNAAFGGGATEAPAALSPGERAQRVRTLAAQLPAREYDLSALAASLPKDPIALYAFVRDNIDVDLYDGVMRGPLGTWLGRAGNPTDKTLLLAWLLVNDGIHLQFVRGTLSNDERARIAQESLAVKPVALDPSLTKEADARARRALAGAARSASTITNELAAAETKLTLGVPPDRIGARHYWIQIDSNGKLLDLDPTLASAREGEHLASLDPSFKPIGTFPGEEFHAVQVRVNATHRDGTVQRVLTYTGRIADLAYAPIRLIGFPHATAKLDDVPKARSFDLTLLAHGESATGTIDLGTANTALRNVTLEVAYQGPGSPQRTIRRWLVPDDQPAAEQPYRLTFLTSMLAVPGAGANAYTLKQRLQAFADLDDDAQAYSKGVTPKPHLIYPTRIAAYFADDDAVARAGGVRLFRSRPNLVMQHTWMRAGSKPDELALESVFDIADNTMSSPSPDAPAVVAANLARSYADETIEADLMRSPSNPVLAVFDSAARQGIATRIVTDGTTASTPLARGLTDTLASGDVAIAPSRVVTVNGVPSFGWWAVDPHTGSSIARTTGGFGATMVEQAMVMGGSAFFAGMFALAVMRITDHPQCRPSGSASGCLRELCEGGVSMLSGYGETLHVRGLLGALGVTIAAFRSGFNPC